MKPIKEEFIRCCCGCGVLWLTNFEDGEINISLFKQHFTTDTWRGRIRIAWNALMGKLYDDELILDKENINKLKEYLNKL